MLAFSTAFFSRIVDSAGAPSAINFLHFLTIPLFCGQVIVTARGLRSYQRNIITAFSFGLGALLSIMLASAIQNDAGFINVVLDFLLLGEPFILLIAFISLPINLARIRKLRTWLSIFCITNLVFAYVQYVLFAILRLHPKPGNPDYIQGIFYHSGGGHVVSASVSLAFGIYYAYTAKSLPLWLRAVVIMGTLGHMLMADAKQVLLYFLVAFILLLITKLKSVGEAIKYFSGAILFGFVFLWCVQNVPAFGAFQTWARPEIYGPDGEATLLKSAALRIILEHYESPLNWLFGLGPGHTVGRLGGWMISGYWDLLGPLGATRHPVPPAVWSAVGQSWLGDQSSMFSPFFGWAGIWGDLGVLGLAAYISLGVITFRHLCLDDYSKLLVFSVFAVGLVFTQMEEPGYMLSVAVMIGLRWQEVTLRRLDPGAIRNLNPKVRLNLGKPKQLLKDIILIPRQNFSDRRPVHQPME
ncbi:hypothetical protein XM38_030570 [Halomicronema hongdechloris C2206]|uniref:Uncharacterized protein n=1 Tax=Halomicronema hongdechloris C2206 TaxID=1641165 RepID=A0A1Z3HP62_9CYAN|nr:hypothetical protein XM38_030570 [Halomicronema hongdechloris C2206]